MVKEQMEKIRSVLDLREVKRSSGHSSVGGQRGEHWGKIKEDEREKKKRGGKKKIVRGDGKEMRGICKGKGNDTVWWGKFPSSRPVI